MGAYRVTRLNGAPPRRAGRAWAEGETLAADLTAEQVGAIGADPGYRIEPAKRADGERAKGRAASS